jgi:hypothetical protein
MKTFTSAALTSVGVSIMLSVSCSKSELEEESKKKTKTASVCDVAVFTQQYGSDPSTPIFNKTYDLSGRRLSRIDAPIYSGGGIVNTLHLNVTYNANTIYFISADNSSDTGLVVTTDNSGRVLRAEAGTIIDNGFGPHEFSYHGNRLHNINIDSNWMRVWFRYDEHGNNTQIVTDSSDGVARVNHQYQYDTRKKGFQSLYFDEARGFSFNVLGILHAAGFFPELNPVHARIRTTVHWGPYQAYDVAQIDHVYDKDGRLMQYKTASPGSNSPIATFSNGYNCATGNEALLTMAQ